MDIFETENGVESYIKMCEGYDNSKFKSKLLKSLKEGSSLLEIGMGPGNDYEWLSNLYQVTGSDYSKAFIEEEAKKNEINKPKGQQAKRIQKSVK